MHELECIILRGFSMFRIFFSFFDPIDETASPKPQMADEPKSPILAIKGTNITIECTAFVTVGTDIVFSWKRDNLDIDAELIETKIRRKDESRLRVKERMVERRREVNRSPLRINVGAAKVPLTSSSVSKMKLDSDDDYEGDDEEIGGELDEDNEYIESDDSIDEVIATVEDIEASIPMNSTVATSRLHLRHVDAKTVGRYQCIASNDFGKAYSQKFKVTVACKCYKLLRSHVESIRKLTNFEIIVIFCLFSCSISCVYEATHQRNR